MVHIVRSNVDEIERDIAAAEKSQSTAAPIKTLIKSFASSFVRASAAAMPCAHKYTVAQENAVG